MSRIEDPAIAHRVAAWLNHEVDVSGGPGGTASDYVEALIGSSGYAYALLNACANVALDCVIARYVPIIEAVNATLAKARPTAQVTKADVTRTEAWIAANGGERRDRERQARDRAIVKRTDWP
jgi:hypothetical protein